jgi:diguanylate cyclase (GGDEF)-like protein
MKILIADDDAFSRRLLERQLRNWEYDVVTARDGAEAWDILQTPDSPRLVVLDWMMPGLTGAPNHAATSQLLDREVLRATCCGQSVAVAMVDLDHFKAVNDTLGHPAGDAVLRECARRIAGAVRPHDVVGRFGGEEFLVVLPGCDPLEAAAVAERIRTALAEKPIPFGRASIDVTASVGVCAMSNAPNAKRLIAAADAALYVAKRGGRNRVEIGIPLPEQIDLVRRHSSRAPPFTASLGGAWATG